MDTNYHDVPTEISNILIVNPYQMHDPITQLCAVKCAISNARHCQVDLTKCTLYTTHCPCLDCTKAILQAGIRVVVWGDGEMEDMDVEIDNLIYRAKIFHE